MDFDLLAAGVDPVENRSDKLLGSGGPGNSKKRTPACRLCVHLIPWLDTSFQSARLEVAAQDPVSLSPWVGVFSPSIQAQQIAGEGE